VPSERSSIEEKSIEYCGWTGCSSIEHLSEGTGTLPEDGNVISKHEELPYIINKLNE
jgi:hypothetical protein